MRCLRDDPSVMYPLGPRFIAAPYIFVLGGLAQERTELRWSKARSNCIQRSSKQPSLVVDVAVVFDLIVVPLSPYF